jgi:hypothetical protein
LLKEGGTQIAPPLTGLQIESGSSGPVSYVQWAGLNLTVYPPSTISVTGTLDVAGVRIFRIWGYVGNEQVAAATLTIAVTDPGVSGEPGDYIDVDGVTMIVGELPGVAFPVGGEGQIWLPCPGIPDGTRFDIELVNPDGVVVRRYSDYRTSGQQFVVPVSPDDLKMEGRYYLRAFYTNAQDSKQYYQAVSFRVLGQPGNPGPGGGSSGGGGCSAAGLGLAALGLSLTLLRKTRRE